MGVLPIRFAAGVRACVARHPWRVTPVDDILVVDRACGATIPPATRQATGPHKGAGILPASSRSQRLLRTLLVRTIPARFL